MTYPVNETFLSWQGEGTHLGRKAFFIRLQGCPVRCSWCDSASTWHPSHVPNDLRKATADELADEAAAAKPEFVVITGGEPCIHDLNPLITALSVRKLPAHLETCGAYPIAPKLAWVTVSPKWAKPPIAEALATADELKVIVENPESIGRWLSALGGTWPCRTVWLHPEWSQRANPEVLRAITDAVKTQGAPFRAGWQVHKPYAADALDGRSRPPAPLGGDASKGY
ncbi:MAG: 7-carboxy-7-deazaguanine synthase QueE [Opitutales bacterium]